MQDPYNTLLGDNNMNISATENKRNDPNSNTVIQLKELLSMENFNRIKMYVNIHSFAQVQLDVLSRHFIKRVIEISSLCRRIG